MFQGPGVELFRLTRQPLQDNQRVVGLALQQRETLGLGFEGELQAGQPLLGVGLALLAAPSLVAIKGVRPYVAASDKF